PAAAQANGRPAALAASAPGGPVERTGPSGKFYSPLVRNIAQSEGVTMEELERIPGTGQGGRVTKKDLLNYLPQRGSAPAAPAPPAAAPVAPATAPATAAPQAPAAPKPLTLAPGDEVIEMDRMRKLIADHMVMSKHTSPHVTSFVEADVTNLVLWRERVKKEVEKREGE